jgi:hypothetical protein
MPIECQLGEDPIARDRPIDDPRLEIRDAPEDPSPVLPDLLPTDEASRGVGRLDAANVLSETVGEGVQIAIIGCLDQSVDDI